MWHDSSFTMLSDYEKWHFDLTGYLILRQAVSPADVQRMLEVGDAWHDVPDDQLPPPLLSYAYNQPGDPRAIDNIIYGDEVFQRLVLNKHIMRVVLSLTGGRPQLLAANFTKGYRDSNELHFHEGNEGGLRNPANDYQAANGQVFATFVNAAVSLVDVPEGAGGFVCVPGSHKSNFPCPSDISLYEGPPVVHNVTVQAGDCVIFTESLRHGARRWTLETPRRTAFARYCTSYASWSPGTGPDPRYRHLLSDDVAELMEMRNFRTEKQVVQKLMAELAAGTSSA